MLTSSQLAPKITRHKETSNAESFIAAGHVESLCCNRSLLEMLSFLGRLIGCDDHSSTASVPGGVEGEKARIKCFEMEACCFHRHESRT
jgi:hypothetical protein